MADDPTSAETKMTNGRAVTTGSRRVSLITEMWRDGREVTKAIISDAWFFVLILVALIIGNLGLQVLRHSGYPSERIERFEAIHYWGYLCCHTMFIVDLIWKLLLALFFGGKK